MMYFMNTIMLGCEIIGARENFVKNRDFFVDVVKLHFDLYDDKRIYFIFFAHELAKAN